LHNAMPTSSIDADHYGRRKHSKVNTLVRANRENAKECERAQCLMTDFPEQLRCRWSLCCGGVWFGARRRVIILPKKQPSPSTSLITASARQGM
jgi:hypothetical protein